MTEKIIPIYSGKPEDFHWAGFGSGSGTNLRECAKVIKPALIFCDRPKAKLLDLEELSDVPRIVLDGYEACGSWKKAQEDPEAKAEYNKKSDKFNEEILNQIRLFEITRGFPIDLIVLGGYMRLVKEPILDAFEDRIINVHPADLTILDHTYDGYNMFHKRKYIGDDAVYDALNNGEKTTKSSVILVDSKVDHGEILTQGPSVISWQEFTCGSDTARKECLRESADAHQTLQKINSDWPALTTALKLIAEGRLGLGNTKDHYNEWRTVYLDGKPLDYEGFQIQR